MPAQLPLQQTVLPCIWHDPPSPRHPQYGTPASCTQLPLQQSLAEVHGPKVGGAAAGVQSHLPFTQPFEQHWKFELHAPPACAQAQWPPVHVWLQHAPSFVQLAPSASQMHVPSIPELQWPLQQSESEEQPPPAPPCGSVTQHAPALQNA